MSAGYSGTPLQRKLGIKPGQRVLLVHEPADYFEMIGELETPLQLLTGTGDEKADFIHLFAEDESVLHTYLPPLKKMLNKNGMLWVSWIKGSSKRDTNINGNDVREFGLRLGLVDVKVCAVDDDWSGLKFMYRKEDR